MWSLAGGLAAELPGHPPRNAVFRLLTLFVQRFLLRFPLFPVARLLSFLNTLQGVDWLHIWWQRYYPWMMPKGFVSDEMVQRGLGERGGYPIPQHVWDQVVSPGVLDAIRLTSASFPGRSSPVSPTVALMIRTLVNDGFLVPGNGKWHNWRNSFGSLPLRHFEAYAKWVCTHNSHTFSTVECADSSDIIPR